MCPPASADLGFLHEEQNMRGLSSSPLHLHENPNKPILILHSLHFEERLILFNIHTFFLHSIL
jgi:hypothetical protein